MTQRFAVIGADPMGADVGSAADLASPDVLHARLGLGCLRAGKPVLCEKPLSQSPADDIPEAS